jgi:hypothetical protein
MSSGAYSGGLHSSLVVDLPAGWAGYAQPAQQSRTLDGGPATSLIHRSYEVHVAGAAAVPHALLFLEFLILAPRPSPFLVASPSSSVRPVPAAAALPVDSRTGGGVAVAAARKGNTHTLSVSLSLVPGWANAISTWFASGMARSAVSGGGSSAHRRRRWRLPARPHPRPQTAGPCQ